MSEEKELSPQQEQQRKSAVLRKAMFITILVFFFGIGLFIALVLGIVKIATKTPGA